MKIKQTRSSKVPQTLIIAVALLSVALLVDSGFTFYLFKRDRSDDKQQIANLIVRSAEALNQPVPIDPISGKAYISVAKLTLPPADNNLGQVLYRYDSGNNAGTLPELNLASRNNISRTAAAVIIAPSSLGGPKDVFERVPELQACVRGITVNFQPHEGQKPAATKLLSNGKTAYFYTESECPNPELLAYVKQIDSY